MKNVGYIPFLIIGMVAGGALYFTFKSEVDQKVVAIEKAQKQIKESTKKKQELSQRLESLRKTRDLISKGYRLDKVERFFPKNYTSNELIELLTTQAQSAEASVINSSTVNFNQKPNEFRGVAARFKLNLTYPQLIILLSRLTGTDKVIVLKDHSMEYINDQGMLDFEGVFEAYYGDELLNVNSGNKGGN